MTALPPDRQLWWERHLVLKLVLRVWTELTPMLEGNSTRAHLLARLGDTENAIIAYDKAISPITRIELRRYLEQQRKSLLLQ